MTLCSPPLVLDANCREGALLTSWCREGAAPPCGGLGDDDELLSPARSSEWPADISLACCTPAWSFDSKGFASLQNESAR